MVGMHFNHERDQSSVTCETNIYRLKKHNHTRKINPEIIWTLFKIGVWEDYLFSFQYLLAKNPHALLLTEYYPGQRQKSKV